MVAKSRAVSQDRLTVLRKMLEEQIERNFEDALVPSLDCVAAGEALEVPAAKWFRPKYLREFARSAEVDVIVAVRYKVEGEPVNIVAYDTQSGDVIGAKKFSWGRIRQVSKSVVGWLTTQEANLGGDI